MESRYESLYARADSLEKSAERIRRVASNLENIRDNDDRELNRLFLINEELGINRGMTWNCYDKDGRKLNCQESLHALMSLEGAGEPLSREILSLIHSSEAERPTILNMAEDLIPKLVSRKMKREEYEAYAQGKKPVAVTYGKPFFVSFDYQN